jgi:hypothetical protein
VHDATLGQPSTRPVRQAMLTDDKCRLTNASDRPYPQPKTLLHSSTIRIAHLRNRLVLSWAVSKTLLSTPVRSAKHEMQQSATTVLKIIINIRFTNIKSSFKSSLTVLNIIVTQLRGAFVASGGLITQLEHRHFKHYERVALCWR